MFKAVGLLGPPTAQLGLTRKRTQRGKTYVQIQKPKKENVDTLIKDIRNPFRLEKENEKTKDRIL